MGKIINGPDGELDAKARLSGTLEEFIEKEVAPELGVPKECAKHLEAHLSGYQLKPNTKIIRDFTELCSGSEMEVHGIEKAMEAMQIMKKQQAAELNVHEAAKTGNLAQLNLVARFAPNRINETGRIGETPLHSAARAGQEAAVSLLLSAKADANKTDCRDTPLHSAAERGQETAVSLLLSAKADVSKADSYGKRPLDYTKDDRVWQLLRDAEP